MKIHLLQNAFLRLSILDLGATIYALEIKPKNDRNVVLTTQDPAKYYETNNGYLGATVGRVAGRIGGGIFSLNGKDYALDQNEKVTNSLHGGNDGFAFKKFLLEKESDDELVFSYESSDGEGGYPGTLKLYVTYTLTKTDFSVKYDATSDDDTLINITNHSYFNLDGSTSILEHVLKGAVTGYYEHDEKQLNKTYHPVTKGSVFSLNEGKPLKEIIFDSFVSRLPAGGLDHLLVTRGPLTFSGEDLTLTVTSNYPAVQLYSTNFPTPYLLLNSNHIFKHHALAIEPVDIVSSNDKTYPNLILKAGEGYHRHINYEFSLK